MIFGQMLDEQWLAAFLLHGKHPAAAAFQDCLLQKYGLVPPQPRTDIFVGRTRQLDAIFAELERPHGKLIVAVDGMGGIGKTAVAAKVHDHYYANTGFDQVIWLSADRAELPFDLREHHPFSFDMILTNIGVQLGEQDMTELSLRQKGKRVFYLLQSRRCLLVLDNLETAVLPQHEIVNWIRPFLNPSRALITSRRRLSGDLFAVHLQGLQPQNAYELIRLLGKDSGLRMLPKDASRLAQIYRVTGGSPLAIKLVVSLLAHLPLDTVLNHLAAAQPLDRLTAEDEYVRCYQDIFMQAWSLLNQDDKQLLKTVAQLKQPEGVSVAMIEKELNLPLAQISHIIQFLWRLSLLEVNEQTSSQDMLYCLHPLTRHFVLSDMAVGEE